MAALLLALVVIAWSTAYAWTDTLPSLLWLARVRREDEWLDSIEAMHETLSALAALDSTIGGDLVDANLQ